MWEISKEFNFEAGHRVWSQKLDRPDLSISTECACKHLHGHSYTLKVFLTSDTLDNSGMVTDFKNLNFMKEFLDDTLDHKFIIDVNDPLFTKITNVKDPKTYVNNFRNLGSIFREHGKINGDDDFLDSFVLVNFVPTSENICKYIGLYAQSILGNVAKVSAIELWETKKSHCRFEF